MKIDDVKFVKRNDGHYWLKINGYWVMKTTFLFAHAAAIENWASICWSVKRSAKEIVSKTHWGAPDERGFNQALGRSVRFFAKHDMLPLRLELALKRNGEPYKGSNRSYVPRGSQLSKAVAVKPAIAVKRKCSIDPRTIRTNPVLLSSAASA
jgi:hypothetical protein